MFYGFGYLKWFFSIAAMLVAFYVVFEMNNVGKRFSWKTNLTAFAGLTMIFVVIFWQMYLILQAILLFIIVFVLGFVAGMSTMHFRKPREKRS